MNFRNEEAFTDAVVDVARMAGWLVHHDRGKMLQHIQGDPGFPDLVLLDRRGQRLIFAELKMKSGVVSREQAEWMKRLSQLTTPRLEKDEVQYRREVEVHLWHPADWYDIVEILTHRR